MYLTENQLNVVYVELFNENSCASVYLAFNNPTVFTYGEDTVICSKDGAITIDCNKSIVMKICYKFPDSDEMIETDDKLLYSIMRIVYESGEGVGHTVYSKIYKW